MDTEWRDYQKLVLGDLKRIESEVKQIKASMNKMNVDLIELKMKSGFIGGVVGSVFSIVVVYIVEFLIRK